MLTCLIGRDHLIISTVMGCPGSVRCLASATLVALLLLTSIAQAAETNVCRVSASPSSDHQQITLKGIVAGLTEGISRGGRKEMTFIFRSPAGK
jgi:hypothetical protein